jgi:cyclase
LLSKRLITVLTFNQGVLFRTKLFRPDYRYTLNFVDSWSVDEIVVLDITRGQQADRKVFFDVVERFARRCFVPLTAGGSIRSLDEVKRFLDSGADKIVVNTGALERPGLITDIAETYGSQCVVLSVDAKQEASGGYRVFKQAGAVPTDYDPVSWAQEGETRGAGEILITAMDRDGWLQGYDIDLCRQVSDAVNVPVLALGGAGGWSHMTELFERTKAAGACTQNIYHFTEASIQNAKKVLSDNAVQVRL